MSDEMIDAEEAFERIGQWIAMTTDVVAALQSQVQELQERCGALEDYRRAAEFLEAEGRRR